MIDRQTGAGGDERSGDMTPRQSRPNGETGTDKNSRAETARFEILGAALLTAARAAIAARWRNADAAATAPAPTALPQLAQPGACFVTLTQQGRLRGCIGSLQARRSLLADLQANACAAAFSDPRFAPLQEDELTRTRIEVSLLTQPQDIACASEQEALAILRPGIDGVILCYGQRRATFLPQVWESLPQATDFLAQLKLKAGLAADFWSPQLRLQRYQVRKWRESEHL